MRESSDAPSPYEPEETILIKTARKDPKAFGDLYKLYVQRVFRYLYSRTGNVQEAEDITAQTFLAAFESFPRFRGDAPFASWLFAIARNKAMDHFRRKKDLIPVENVESIPVNSDPLQAVIRTERLAVLSSLIQKLPEEERELLRLRFLAGMSFQEMAHLLERNQEAVKKEVYRLLVRLQSQVEVFDD